MKVRNIILLYGVSMIVGLYTTFVLTALWGWFVSPAFHVNAISFWVMYGLTLLIGLFRSTGSDIEADNRHKIVAIALDACIPAERLEKVTEKLRVVTEQVWYGAAWKVFGQIIGNSVTLGIGFLVHVLSS
ncbi:MAG: hypothetical protein WBD67_07895 [Terracidiphilus sp.]